MFRRVFMLSAVLLAGLIPATAIAQTAAAVGGVVRDSSGGAIPGATVRVINEATGAAQEAVSDAEGRYQVTDLAPGQYRVEAALDGFEPAVARGAVDGRQAAKIDVTLTPARFTEGVVVTARRVEEAVQEVPIPVSVLSGELVASAGAFNVNRVKELIPTVQFYSSNPRNSAVTIRGIGSPFGLTNDGIEPGVGLYIDGVFYARPASATLDFLDVAQVEVLRGPQGTLFGKNTTAGAINVTSRRPTLHARERTSSSPTAATTSSRPRPRSRVRSATRSPDASRSRARGRDGFIYNTADAGRDEHAEQPRLPRPAARDAVEVAWPSTSRSITRGSARRVRAGDRRCGADAASGESAVGADRRRSQLHAAELQRVRSPDGHRHELAVQPGSRRRVGQRSTGRSDAAA